jgi:hypothetical protein
MSGEDPKLKAPLRAIGDRLRRELKMPDKSDSIDDTLRRLAESERSAARLAKPPTPQ